MPLEMVLGFAAVAITLIVSPGPDWAYILAAGVRDRVVLPAVAGLTLGYALITIAVAIGVGPLVAEVPFALTALTLTGAGYLAYLGVQTLRSTGRVPTSEPAAALASSPIGYLIKGMGVSALNPKGLLIFLSILPQFASNSASWPLAAQLAALGGVFVAIAALFYLALGYASNRFLGTRPAVASLTTRVTGTAMIIVGITLFVERARELM